jgi:hypothetical protein
LRMSSRPPAQASPRCSATGISTPRSGTRRRSPAPPFLHGVPWDGFPRFRGTTACSVSWPPVPPRVVSFAWGDRARARPSIPGTANVSGLPSTPAPFFRNGHLLPGSSAYGFGNEGR